MSRTTPSQSRPTSSPPARGHRQPTKAEFRRTVVATFVAIVVALVLGAIGADALVVGGVAYASFVAALTLGRRGHQAPTEPGFGLEGTAPRYGLAVELPNVPLDELVDLDRSRSMTDATQEIDLTRELDAFVGDDRPLRHRGFGPGDLAELGIAAISALAVAGVVRAVWGLHGPTGTVIWGYLAFLALFYVLVRDRLDAEGALDRVVTVVMCTIGLLITSVVVWMLVYLIGKGAPGISGGFFTEDMSTVGPLTPGGGVFHAIIGTFEQVGIAIIFVVPLAILTATYLHEMKGRMAKPLRFIVDAMSGLPSIVAGLLIFTIWVTGRGYSGFAASLALIVLMLPTVTRTSEEILRTIPDSLREASLALGAPQWRVVLKVVLPTARSGLVTAVILGIARAAGETAPALLTALGSDVTNANPFKGPQSSLPLFAYNLIKVPNKVQNQRAWSAMLVLVALVLVLFLTARFVAARGDRKLGRGR